MEGMGNDVDRVSILSSDKSIDCPAMSHGVPPAAVGTKNVS